MENQTGLLTKRSYDHKVKIKDLINELHNLHFELLILKECILSIKNHDYSAFDSSVGDWKCQTRTSMLIDFMHIETDWQNQLTHELDQIELCLQKITNTIATTENYNFVQQQEFTKVLQEQSLYTYLVNSNILSYQPSHELFFLGLCFLTTIKNHHNNPIFIQSSLSKDKSKKIITLAKQQLCSLSIHYAKRLAKEYGTKEEQIALQQIETKNIQSMTSLFVEFKSVFAKMKLHQQPFIVRTTIFCSCNKVQGLFNTRYTCNNGYYEINNQNSISNNEAITVIEAYQAPKSLYELQSSLSVSSSDQGIPSKYYEPCQCINPTPIQPIQDIDLAIMAFFAQHPQFTNLKPIDFEGLGLANSQIKKEYDYLLTLPGFSRLDMTIFHINHMYPSTIAAVLQESEEMVQAMIARQPAAPLMQSIKPAQKIQSIARHIANALCTHHCCVS